MVDPLSYEALASVKGTSHVVSLIRQKASTTENTEALDAWVREYLNPFYPPWVLVTVLSATSPRKQELPSRALLYQVTFEVLVKLRGTRQAELILEKLK